jgi:type II secretory pathway pseudopilin PulG
VAQRVLLSYSPIMKRRLPHAFTLIEMVTVVAVIIVLAGLVIGVAGFVQSKGAREKALTQIKNLSLQCEAYKVDNGTVPQNEDTDTLDARVHFSPISGASGPLYQAASRYLYSCLSGDYEPPLAPDFQPEKGERRYHSFKRDELGFSKNPDGSVRSVNYVQDPFGNPFGYSTIAAKAEAEYRKKLRENPNEPRPDTKEGYNPTFDLWSTGGATSGNSKWIKNWGN